ncbi:MAG: ribosomal protein S18-alanine N-acetyltransferase [Candidatus Gastranaerophilales bacterium]|nr:ribosomal protein S18-alanine N-acetyltransferase [Candidatus Gastranaerophilales bacterium]
MSNAIKKLQIKIRPMQRDDIESIMAIESSVYGEHHWSKEGFETEIYTDIGNYYCLFDADKNKLIGYGGFWNILDEGHITTVAIDKQYQGMGLSEVLIQKFFEVGYRKEIKWFTLEVRVSNVAAFHLYKKYLFESCGVRPKYYQDTQEDALIMWTENIHNDKFKLNYEALKQKTTEKIEII